VPLGRVRNFAIVEDIWLVLAIFGSETNSRLAARMTRRQITQSVQPDEKVP
jgi:hypothetical protein